MGKTKFFSGTILSPVLVAASSLLFVSWLSQQNAEAGCPPICVDEAKQHLDEAKKSLDAGDKEGSETHIDKAKESLDDSTEDVHSKRFREAIETLKEERSLGNSSK